LRDTRIRASEEEGDEDDAKKKYSKGKKDWFCSIFYIYNYLLKILCIIYTSLQRPYIPSKCHLCFVEESFYFHLTDISGELKKSEHS
jgi:hypothetical protein